MAEFKATNSQVWKREEQCKIDILAKFLSNDRIILGVSRVIQFSSQYNDNTWSANQVVGPPKVYPRHGM